MLLTNETLYLPDCQGESPDGSASARPFVYTFKTAGTVAVESKIWNMHQRLFESMYSYDMNPTEENFALCLRRYKELERAHQ